MTRTLTVLVLVVLTLAGCGGGGGKTEQKPLTKQQYGRALVNAARDANRAGQKAMDEIAAGNSKGVVDLKESIKTFHETLADLDAPRSAQPQHDRLVSASEQLANQFAAAVDKQDPKTVATLRPLTNMTRYPGGRAVQRLTAALDAKGFDVG